MAPVEAWRRIAGDEALTRGLDDAEARIIVEWLVEQVELADEANLTDPARQSVIRLIERRGRIISRFLWLWCHRNQQAAAHQLAASERCSWPFPAPDTPTEEVLRDILIWETQQRGLSRAG